jgi:hypothetical protein
MAERRSTGPAKRAQPRAASPKAEPAVDETAAGPSTAVAAERQVEAPVASPAIHDATVPTSGTRGARPGSKAGPGGAEIAKGGNRTTSSVPVMPGPTGAAQTTELAGDSGLLEPGHDATPPGPVRVPGGGGTGPIDPIYDVARIQRQEAERRRTG